MFSMRTPLRSLVTLAMNLNILLLKKKICTFKLISFLYSAVLRLFYFLDRVDEVEAFEISDEGEDEDELALTPHSHRAGQPSIPSPVKALFVSFLHNFYLFINAQHYIFSRKKNLIQAENWDEEMTVTGYAVELYSLSC